MKRAFFSALLGLVLAGIGASALAATPRLMHANDAAIEEAAAPSATGADGLTLRIDIPGQGPRDVTLERAMPFSPGTLPAPSGRDGYYQGALAGNAASWVRLNRIDGTWSGVIHDGAQLWLIDPVRQHAEFAAARGMHPESTVIYTLDDVAGLPDFHGDTLIAGASTDDAAQALEAQAALAPAAMRWLRVTLVLDTEFQTKWGARAGAVAAGLINIADGFYRSANTRVYLHALVPLKDNGTLTATDSSALLTAFSALSSGSSSIPFRSLAHLVSGKNFDGSTIGLAYIGKPDTNYVDTVCSRKYGTGVNQITASEALGGITLAHEMGHNYGSEHDGDGNACASSGFVMGPSLGSSIKAFSQCSLNAFATYLAAKRPTCLDDAPDPIYADAFDAAAQ